jgi:hypothetical protein
LTGLSANQLEKLLQKMAGLIFNGEILSEPKCLDELGWGIDEQIFQMPKEEIDLLVRKLRV